LQAWRNQEFDGEKTRQRSASAAAKMASDKTVNRGSRMKKINAGWRDQEKNLQKENFFPGFAQIWRIRGVLNFPFRAFFITLMSKIFARCFTLRVS
jgi:hypothetical protein